MSDFLTALALVLVIEGLIYAIMPETMKHMVEQVLALPSDRLRLIGVLLAAIGVMFTWIIRG